MGSAAALALSEDRRRKIRDLIVSYEQKQKVHLAVVGLITEKLNVLRAELEREMEHW